MQEQRPNTLVPVLIAVILLLVGTVGVLLFLRLPKTNNVTKAPLKTKKTVGLSKASIPPKKVVVPKKSAIVPTKRVVAPTKSAAALRKKVVPRKAKARRKVAMVKKSSKAPTKRRAKGSLRGCQRCVRRKLSSGGDIMAFNPSMSRFQGICKLRDFLRAGRGCRRACGSDFMLFCVSFMRTPRRNDKGKSLRAGRIRACREIASEGWKRLRKRFGQSSNKATYRRCLRSWPTFPK